MSQNRVRVAKKGHLSQYAERVMRKTSDSDEQKNRSIRIKKHEITGPYLAAVVVFSLL